MVMKRINKGDTVILDGMEAEVLEYDAAQRRVKVSIPSLRPEHRVRTYSDIEIIAKEKPMTRQRINKGDMVKMRDGGEAEVLENDICKRRVKVRYMRHSSVEPRQRVRICEPEEIEEVIGGRKLEAYLSPGNIATMKDGTKVLVKSGIKPSDGWSNGEYFIGSLIRGGDGGVCDGCNFFLFKDINSVKYKEPKMTKLEPTVDPVTVPHLTLADLRQCMESGELVAFHPATLHAEKPLNWISDSCDGFSIDKIDDSSDRSLFYVTITNHITKHSLFLSIRGNGMNLANKLPVLIKAEAKKEKSKCVDFSVGDVVRVCDGNLVEVGVIDELNFSGWLITYDCRKVGLAYSDLHKINFSEIDKIELRKNDFMRSEFADRMYNLAKQNYEAKQPISHLTIDNLKKCAESGELVGWHPEYLAIDPEPCGISPLNFKGIRIIDVFRDSLKDDFMIYFEFEPSQYVSKCVVLSHNGCLASRSKVENRVPVFTRLKSEPTLDNAIEGGRTIDCGESNSNKEPEIRFDIGEPEVLNETQIPTPHGTLKNQRIQDRWGGELYKVRECKKGCYETGCMCSRDEEE